MQYALIGLLVLVLAAQILILSRQGLSHGATQQSLTTVKALAERGLQAQSNMFTESAKQLADVGVLVIARAQQVENNTVQRLAAVVDASAEAVISEVRAQGRSLHADSNDVSGQCAGLAGMITDLKGGMPRKRGARKVKAVPVIHGVVPAGGQ